MVTMKSSTSRRSVVGVHEEVLLREEDAGLREGDAPSA